VPTVSRQRFLRWFAELADIGRTDAGWNRVAWTPLEVEAQDWFRGAAESVGLEVRRDGAGTLWATEPGAGAGPYVCAGSHLDTQPDGGAYDGALGMVCALEAVAAVRESGPADRRPLAVVAFVDEEGARFSTACFASRAIAGELDVDAVLAAMGDAPAIHGVTRESLLASRAELARVACFLEVHVEQGKALVDRGQALGIADVLAPRRRYRATFEGESNHAGTTPMAGRRDALVEAARFVLVVEEAARARPGAVATVGRVAIAPGSTNSIPGRVTCSLDVRALTGEAIDAVMDGLRARFADAEIVQESASTGATFDAGLREALHRSAEASGVPAGDLPSYAGHDAGILAGYVPAAMIFVRNPTGASHNPAEFASDDDCVAAAQVLAGALSEVAAQH
jgi:beta-ureidopropionase / N-carbamoyl-L-amino-acid hydrolase